MLRGLRAERGERAPDCEVTVEMSMIGKRVIVTGPTSSGKSTLAAELARRLGLPFVELDALFWEPNWVECEGEVFRERVRKATAGDAWVIAGNYFGRTQDITWPRAETVVFLDFGLPLILRRVVARSWRRWRSKELLWGTNYERFWDQFTRPNKSLLVWAWKARRTMPERWLRVTTDPALAHIRFVRLRSPREAARWVEAIGREEGAGEEGAGSL